MEFAAIKSAGQDADQESAEQRGARRFTLLIRAAKLIADQGEFICVIRDVSSTGVSVRLFHDLPATGSLALELQSGEQYEVERVWQRPGEAGFSFAKDLDVERFVCEVGTFPKRGLRLGIQFPAVVSVHGERHEAMVDNISQQGACILSDGKYAIDQALTIEGEGLAEVRAKVRWRADGSYGIVFDDTFTLPDFAVLAAQMQAPRLITG